MRADRSLATVVVLAAMAAAGCGADDEPAARNATTTTARTTAVITTTTPVTTTAVTTTPATTTPVATAPAAALSASAAAEAVTPGTSAQGAANVQDIACARASATQATLSVPGATAGVTTTPGSTTTTPEGVTTTTPEGVTTTTPEDVTTTTQGETILPGEASTTEAPETTILGADADQAVLARPFSSTSPWNTPIETRVVDSRSNGWIEQASRRVAVVASENRRSVATTERTARDLRLYINTCAWTPTIVGEDGGETVSIVCRQRNCGEVAKQVKTLRVPPNVEPFPEFDGWYSVIDESAGVGYDMWRARRVGDVISYQFIKRWQLRGPGFSPPAIQDPTNAVGARGSGLPLFAGVIQPAELRQGRIDHALAISVPGPAQRVFVPPASVTNGINVIDSLPEGSRLRLRSSFKLDKVPRGANRRSAEAIVTALRTYGAIVVDRSITPTLYARRSTNYGTLLVGNELQGLRLRDLEVVLSPSLLRFPPLDTTPEVVQK